MSELVSQPDRIEEPTGPQAQSASAWSKFKRNRAAYYSLWILGGILGISIAAPILSPFDYDTVSWDAIGTPPSLTNGHIFGTDYTGRDVFVRTALGVKISFLVGFVAAIVSVSIGTTYGAIAGYFRGNTDAVMMRMVDALYAVPFMFFVIIIMVLFGRNFFLLFVAIGAIQWLTMSRIVRAQTMALRERGFVVAAEIAGASPRRIIWRHIAPNLIGIVIIYMTLTIPDIIMIESFLSFLGLGVQEPLTSLGVLIADGAKEMYTAPWLLIVPATTLVVSLLCLNMIGDGLRDAFDPKDAGER